MNGKASNLGGASPKVWNVAITDITGHRGWCSMAGKFMCKVHSFSCTVTPPDDTNHAIIVHSQGQSFHLIVSKEVRFVQYCSAKTETEQAFQKTMSICTDRFRRHLIVSSSSAVIGSFLFCSHPWGFSVPLKACFYASGKVSTVYGWLWPHSRWRRWMTFR